MGVADSPKWATVSGPSGATDHDLCESWMRLVCSTNGSSLTPARPQPAMYETLAIRTEQPGFCVAHGGPLVVPVWTRTAVGEHVDLLAEAQRHVLREFPVIIVLTIIRAKLSMSVREDVRARGRANVAEFGDRTVRSVLVVEEGGLRASFFRSVVTGVFFLSRNSRSQRVSSSIDDGLEWLFEPFEARVAVDLPHLEPGFIARLCSDAKRFADDVVERYPAVAD